MADQALFYFAEEIQFEEKAAAKFLKGNILDALRQLHNKLAALETFGEKELEAVFVQLMEQLEIKLGKIAQPMRVALTGTSVSPGIFEIMIVLGKTRVLERLGKAIDYIEANKP
jgi:glutamyl-tRNA synthetase